MHAKIKVSTTDCKLSKIYQIAAFKFQLKKLFLRTQILRSMATYKKRGLKPKDRKDQQSLESQSATAEVLRHSIKQLNLNNG